MWFSGKAPVRRPYKFLLCLDGSPVAQWTREAAGEDELASAADQLAERYLGSAPIPKVPELLGVLVLDAEDRFVLHRKPDLRVVPRWEGVPRA